MLAFAELRVTLKQQTPNDFYSLFLKAFTIAAPYLCTPFLTCDLWDTGVVF